MAIALAGRVAYCAGAMTASKNIRYIPAVDHLRAYAATLVVMYHCFHLISYQLRWQTPWTLDHWPRANNPFTAVLYEGHSGVALFMVLSGFIFTYGGAGRELQYGNFLLNRVLRIYPLMLALFFIDISAFPSPAGLPRLFQTLLPLQNLQGGLPAGDYNSMSWTVAVEFQFYLLYPFLHRQLVRRGVRGLLPLLVWLLVARWSALLLGGNPRDFGYWTILGRLDQFLIGMMAAAVALRLTFASPWLRAALPVGLTGLGAALWLFNSLGGWPVVAGWKILWPPVEACLWALVVLGYIAVRHGQDGPISRVIAGVGTVSYSMYLTQMVVLTIFLREGIVLRLPGWPYLSAFLTGACVVLPVIILVSTLTYRTIEKPFLELRRKYLAPMPEPQPVP